MRTLTKQEKRTVRLGAAVVVIYFAIFGGLRGWTFFSQRRADYEQMVKEAQSLKQEVRTYEDKVAVIKKLMESFKLDPAKLSRASVVAQTSAAIQKTATGGGMQVGPVRESPARPSSKELAAMQLEGSGPVPAVMGFLHRLESVGYPL